MIQKINSFSSEDTYKVFTLNIQKNDTIVIQIDQDMFDMTEANQLLKIWRVTYPNNKIMVTFKGVEIQGVLHEE